MVQRVPASGRSRPGGTGQALRGSRPARGSVKRETAGIRAQLGPKSRRRRGCGRRDISYYRRQAKRAKRLSDGTTDQEMQEALASAAQDFADIADDLERGAVEVRHPELVTQSQHDAAGPANGARGSCP